MYLLWESVVLASFVLIFGHVSGFLFRFLVVFILLSFNAFLWLHRTSYATPNTLNLKGNIHSFSS